MYTTLLIDDEAAMLDTLTNNIHWHQFGVSTILTASDGRQALDIMALNKVDLLITDIQMPNMDGLSLLSEVRTLYPDTHCILLSAYGEFEYAQKAIKLGVENYLLKPLQIEELEETIEKALNNIYASTEISKHLFHSNILSRWVNGSISSADLSERASLINVNLYLPEYCVVCVSKKKQAMSLSNYCKICAEQLSSAYETHYFQDERKRRVFIIGGGQLVLKQLLSVFTKEATKLELNHLIIISIGNIVQDINNLPESYHLACSLIDSADLSSADMTVLMPNKGFDQEESKLLQDLNTIFHLQEEEARQHNFYQLAENLFKLSEKYSSDKAVTMLNHSMTRLFSQEFSNNPVAQEQLCRRMKLPCSLHDKDSFTASIIDLLEYSYLLFNYYFEQLSPIVQTAISYIHENYKEGISIKDFCVKNRMSTPYLGYLFKKETGLFFNNYLMQYRICSSIRLLLDTSQNINDIAANVGFSSPSYYILCFKKQTGLSPTKYRITKS